MIEMIVQIKSGIGESFQDVDDPEITCEFCGKPAANQCNSTDTWIRDGAVVEVYSTSHYMCMDCQEASE